MISQGIHVNMLDDAAVNRDGGILDFCRLNDITIQPWSPFQYGFLRRRVPGQRQVPGAEREDRRNRRARYGVSNTTIAMAWLLRHPAKMQPVTGTMNAGRLRDCAKSLGDQAHPRGMVRNLPRGGHILP